MVHYISVLAFKYTQRDLREVGDSDCIDEERWGEPVAEEEGQHAPHHPHPPLQPNHNLVGTALYFC